MHGYKTSLIQILLIFSGIHFSFAQYTLQTDYELLKSSDSIIFHRQTIINKVGVAELKNALQNTTDSISKQELSFFFDRMLSVYENAISINPIDTLLIEVSKDSIMRHIIDNGRQIGDFELLTFNDSIRRKVGKNRKFIYGGRNIFKNSDKYIVQEFPNDKKVIEGFNCYKVIITNTEKPEKHEVLNFDMGRTIYDCYITKEINLPFHTVYDLGKYLPNMFPVEIIVKQEKFSFLEKKYNLMSIDFN